MTRGPLPAEVYWRRRLIVLAVALLLVVGLARLLGAGSDGAGGPEGTATASDPSGADATAARAGADASVTPGTAGTPTGSESAEADDGAGAIAVPGEEARAQGRAEKKAARQAARVAAAAAAAEAARIAATVPEPQGPCAASDVVVTPSLPAPVAGSDMPIVLDLSTRFSPACSWTLSPDQLALKITSGNDDIFSTQQCPGVVPTQELVLRRAATTQVQLTWNGKRSDADCSGRTDWALPGYYYVFAAALAGEPTDVQFELTAPQPAQVVETVPAEPTTTTREQRRAQKARSTRQAQRQG